VPCYIASPLLNASQRTGSKRTLLCRGEYSYFIFCEYWVQISIRVRTIVTETRICILSFFPLVSACVRRLAPLSTAVAVFNPSRATGVHIRVRSLTS
jgi:hypothetical protein